MQNLFLRLNNFTSYQIFRLVDSLRSKFNLMYSVYRMYSGQLGDLGSGAGKGGGGGGSIREAGGSFGKMEAAREEEYFYKQVRYL